MMALVGTTVEHMRAEVIVHTQLSARLRFEASGAVETLLISFAKQRSMTTISSYIGDRMSGWPH